MTPVTVHLAERKPGKWTAELLLSAETLAKCVIELPTRRAWYAIARATTLDGATAAAKRWLAKNLPGCNVTFRHY